MREDTGRVGDADQALVASDGAAAHLHPLGFDPSRFFREPSEEELNEGARLRFERFGAFNIDRWPPAILALSMPTKLIPIDDLNSFGDLFDFREDMSEALRYAALIDDAVGWDNHFIRLNSRSPKDASYPVPPITNSGKQAMSWILASERCLDDIVTMGRAQEPVFICCREWRFIPPASEVRCFAKDGRVLGVSRYDYGTEPDEDWLSADLAAILGRAEAFYAEHLAKHYATVVFDLALNAETPLLIELNPYGLSDPCCFASYEKIEDEGGVAIAMEARQGGDGETRLHPKDDSAGRRHRPERIAMTNTVLREPSELVERMTDEQIKHMVQRFLCWKLPEHFCPDAGISFDPVFNKGTPYEMRHQPIGTNLFGYDEAKAMVRFMLEGLPASPTPEPCRLREALIEARSALDSSQREIFELVGYSENEIDAAMADFVTANKGFRAIDSALSASPAEPQETTEAIPNWKLVHAVRSGALNALRHAGVSEELFAVVASATYAPIRAAMRSAASGGDTV